MRKLIIATTLIAFLPASAHAQLSTGGGGEYKGPATARTDHEKKVDAAIDKDYQDLMKRTQGKPPPANTDPWGPLRPAGNDGGKK